MKYKALKLGTVMYDVYCALCMHVISVCCKWTISNAIYYTTATCLWGQAWAFYGGRDVWPLPDLKVIFSRMGWPAWWLTNMTVQRMSISGRLWTCMVSNWYWWDHKLNHPAQWEVWKQRINILVKWRRKKMNKEVKRNGMKLWNWNKNNTK